MISILHYHDDLELTQTQTYIIHMSKQRGKYPLNVGVILHFLNCTLKVSSNLFTLTTISVYIVIFPVIMYFNVLFLFVEAGQQPGRPAALQMN